MSLARLDRRDRARAAARRRAAAPAAFNWPVAIALTLCAAWIGVAGGLAVAVAAHVLARLRGGA